MRIEARLVGRICLLAGIKGRQQQCFAALCEGRSAEEVAAMLHVSPPTVYTHLRRAKLRIRKIQRGHRSLREWWEFILEDCIPNGENPSPATPQFEPNDYGTLDRVRIQGARPLTVDDLVGPYEVEV